ncbi:MAG TPA: alpha/beta hydrolase [Blastocatellia bacterium]|nr:alpha/beta hydrolase [Blastocatellia bacterium]
MSVRQRNNINVFGRGAQPLIFAHGFGCDQNMWRFITPAFADDYRIVLFDLVGCGHSDLTAYDPAKYASLDGYATDVLEICAELDLTDVILVGHSVSAMISVLAAIREPARFSRLIHIGPSPCYLNDDNDGYVGGFTRPQIDELLDFLDNNYMGWSVALAPVIMGNAERPELAEELQISFCATDPEIARRFARVTFLSDNRKDLPRLQAPSLVLQCSDDAIAPLAVGQYVAEHSPNSRLVVLQATGHCPHLSAPEEIIAVMKEYLA